MQRLTEANVAMFQRIRRRRILDDDDDNHDVPMIQPNKAPSAPPPQSSVKPALMTQPPRAITASTSPTTRPVAPPPGRSGLTQRVQPPRDGKNATTAPSKAGGSGGK
jgi:hypothetical protein